MPGEENQTLDIYQLSANLSKSILNDLLASYNKLKLGDLSTLDGTRIRVPEVVGYASLSISTDTLSVYFKISQEQLDSCVMRSEVETMGIGLNS